MQMDKSLGRNLLFRMIIKEFAAPLVIATALIAVILYGHLPL